MIIGGQAVLYWGFPRLTGDVDVTLGVDTDAFEPVYRACRKEKLEVLIKDPAIFVQDMHVLPMRDTKTGLRVDLIFSNTPYERQAIKRAHEGRLGKIAIKFASLEDVMIHKLIAGRPIDIEDVRVLMEKHRPHIDMPYVQKWLEEFSALGTLKTDPIETFNEIRDTKQMRGFLKGIKTHIKREKDRRRVRVK